MSSLHSLSSNLSGKVSHRLDHDVALGTHASIVQVPSTTWSSSKDSQYPTICKLMNREGLYGPIRKPDSLFTAPFLHILATSQHRQNELASHP